MERKIETKIKSRASFYARECSGEVITRNLYGADTLPRGSDGNAQDVVKYAYESPFVRLCRCPGRPPVRRSRGLGSAGAVAA